MQQLKAADAAFLQFETDNVPMHVASVELMELPAGVAVDQFIDDLRKHVEGRLHLASYLTNRLQTKPLGLDQAVWVKDEAFDIARHVFRVEAPAPGGQAEMEATIARLHEEPMDRAHPLWEWAVVTGLQNNRIAIYSRIHHCTIDGVSGTAAVQLADG